MPEKFRFWNRLPFIARLLVTASMALLVAGALMIFIVTGNEATEIKSDLRAELAKELETLPAALVETVAVGDFATVQQVLDRYVQRPLIAAIRFDDTSGTHLLSQDQGQPREAPDWFIASFGFSDLEGSTPVVIGGRAYGTLQIKMTATPPVSRAWHHLRAHLGILLLAILLDFIGIWLVLRHGLQPLELLRHGAQQMAAGQLDLQLEMQGAPEMREVILSFNHMAAALAVTDLQRRRQAEEIEEQSQRVNAILAGTNVGSWEWQVPTGKTIYNDRWAEMLGYTLDELSPLSIATSRRLTHPDDCQHVLDLLEKHFAGEMPYFECEVRMRHKDGHWVWVLDRGKVSRWGEDGKPLLMSGTHQDISERKALESELIEHRHHLEKLVDSRTADLEVAKNAAEAANRAKSAFLSMASHELRTPMNGVMGMIALAMNKASDPQQQEYLAKASRASNQLLAIINDVLDISRIEANRLTLAETAFTLEQIVGNVRDALEDAARAKDIALGVSLEPALAQRSWLGDPTRLAQILINLTGNAVKFTEHGGVALSVRDLSHGAEAEPTLRFEIQDTGIGILQEDQQRIFEPFEQVDASISRKYGGTGLGLSLCKKLITAMGGRIGVSSEFGAGSQFWFELRFKPAQEAAVSSNQDDYPPGDQLLAEFFGNRVLLVEDDPLNQQIIQIMLEVVGQDIYTVTDGLEAVEQARRQHFGIILMDMNMPKMGGIEATAEIRRLPGHAATPIIALTANAFDDDREACLAAGMNDHLSKPVTADTLYRTMLRWLKPEQA